ncbi:MAG: site-specific DNA-methyltransferase [Planctomycetota bacterium]|jgi:adenine-specific DNA-methyltransferase
MAILNFKGKAFVQNYHLQVKYHQLIPRKNKSLTKKVSLHDNLIIHGDNLKALKSLLPTYAGKIKCIYIDPPYNTGNEKWAYNDNVNSPMMQEWLGKVVDKEDLTRHDKWLCMMMPRLKLLKELLSEDGVIFISIDDNEIHNLLALMNDKLFFEENFRNIIIIRRGVKSVQAQFDQIDRLAIGAEYVVAYTRDQLYKFDQFRIDLEDHREGAWNNHWRGTDRPTMRYELFGITPESGQWRWSESRSKEAVANYKKMLKETGRTEDNITQQDIDTWYFSQLEDGEEPDLLRLSSNGKPEHFIPPSDTKYGSSLWSDLKPNGNAQLKKIFGKKVFDNPKSVDLVKRLFRLAGVKENDIVLDSFAGSGTTAQALLELNKEDGANCRFVLVQIPESIEKTHPAYKMGFREIIEITTERVRRVIKGVPKAKDENLKKGLGGTFSYFDLGPPIEMEAILSGDNFPSYADLARYVFYTATGEEFDADTIDETKNFIGESRDYLIYLFYKPDIEYLKATALTLDKAKALGPYKKKRRLVFAPTKYLDQEHLDELRIDFAQLPFEIYQLVK